MNNQLQALLLLIALTTVSGCGVMHITYQRVNPPEANIEAFNEPTLVMYRFDTAKWDFNQKKKIAVYREAFNAFDEAFRESLRKLQQFNLSYDTTLHIIKWLSPQQKLSLDSKWVQQIAEDKPYTFYILVNQFNLSRHQDTETYENDDGSKSKTAYYFLHADAQVDIWDKDGILLDESALQERILIDERGVISGLLAVGPAVGNFGDEANEISQALGFKYYHRFFPSEELVNNYYYIDKELKTLQPLMESRNWEEAKEQLLTMYPLTSAKMKRHVAHNLAIIHEILGDAEQANVWWERSY